MTKKQKRMLWAWYNAKATKLSDCYSSWSDEKQEAFDWCTAKMKRYEGRMGCIPSHSGWKFTYAFIFEKVNPETAVVETWLDYETADASYEFMITDNVFSVWKIDEYCNDNKEVR